MRGRSWSDIGACSSGWADLTRLQGLLRPPLYHNTGLLNRQLTTCRAPSDLPPPSVFYVSAGPISK
ncbi:hypothetical protein IF2G_05325 [Cordyceps javanica]|nr:hypothetical protein IF2G_05325 [Cordyceps javanica]